MKWPVLSALIVVGALLLALSGLQGGHAETVTDATPVPAQGEPGAPTYPLSSAELDQWIRGRAIFDRDFQTDQGLGADFNGDSCRSCHEDPVIGGAGGLDLNVSRYANDNSGQGPFSNLPGGQVVSRVRRPDMPGRDELDPAADVFEQRQTPTSLGVGAVDTIADATIIANEDPNDLDGDGISGRARLIDVAGVPEVGKFGWKAQMPTGGDFVQDALGGEIGITVPDDGRGFGFLSDNDTIPDPELGIEDLDDLTFFVTHLAPPERKGSTNPLVMDGEMLFAQVGCVKCHMPTLMGSEGPVNLYSDLLLHDIMGTGFRGMAEPGAAAGEFRTPPLWGISDTAPYLHDGRAETLLDTIQNHSGEAAGVKAAFDALNAGQRESIILFLEDL